MESKKRRAAYNVLTLLGAIVLLCFITRLWPIILLAIVGVIFACMVLLFRSQSAKEEPSPAPITPLIEAPPTTEHELVRIALGIIQRRITAELLPEYPNVRWIWETPHVINALAAGERLSILLNRAGGYKRAFIEVRELQFIGLRFDEPVSSSANNHPLAEAQPSSAAEADEEQTEPENVNYELMAYGWVENNMLRLAALCSEAIGQKQTTFYVPASDLPEKESWEDICRELIQHDFPDAQVTEDGIEITSPQ